MPASPKTYPPTLDKLTFSSTDLTAFGLQTSTRGDGESPWHRKLQRGEDLVAESPSLLLHLLCDTLCRSLCLLLNQKDGGFAAQPY